MNAKTCKKLRRLIGKPVTVTNGNGRTYQKLIAVNDPKSTRGVYRGLKSGDLRIAT